MCPFSLSLRKNKSNYKIFVIAINDKRLSFSAKGIFSYLYSKPNNYKLDYNDFLSNSSDEYDTIKQAVDELRSFGYLHII